MKLLCTGDSHLGAGTDYGNAPGERLAEQEAVWDRALEIADERQVDAVLFAGDAFEKRRPTPEEMVAFQRPLLKRPGLPVIAIPGNHDIEHADRATGLDVIGAKGPLALYRHPCVVEIAPLGKDAPAIAVLPWTPVSRMVAANGGGDRDETHSRAAELLLDTARELRGEIPEGRPAILLLHWSVSGASLPTGLPTDTLREPVIPLSELEELGFDAVIAGHIHHGGVFGWSDFRAHRGPVLYVGSPMPLNFAEANDDHGVWILDTDTWVPEFVPIESRPFVTLDFDAQIAANPPMIEGATEGAIVKIRYTATAEEARRIDHAKIREALLDAGAHRVYAIEASIERPQRARAEGLDEGIGPLEALRAYVDANEIDGMTAGQMTDRTAAYLAVAS